MPAPTDQRPAPPPEVLVQREQRPLEPDFVIPPSLPRQFAISWKLFYTSWNNGTQPTRLVRTKLQESEQAWPVDVPRPEALDQVLMDIAEFST